jgi:hypothetical protein
MAEGNETKLKIDGCTKSSRLFAAILNIFSDEKKAPAHWDRGVIVQIEY